MNTKKTPETYVAFLRGINVGGHHKVPMADLRQEMEKLGFQKVATLLNSGNIIFEAPTHKPEQLEKIISNHLEQVFGFPIPTLVRSAKTLEQLYKENPFQKIKVTKDIRLYVSFLKNDPAVELDLPWASADYSYRILNVRDKTILSVLDLAVSNTPKAMEALEQFFGKEITTRNWKTVERVMKKL
ncbi:DUF1697 domain-containing protein [Flavobacteriaceae bacterium 3-367]